MQLGGDLYLTRWSIQWHSSLRYLNALRMTRYLAILTWWNSKELAKDQGNLGYMATPILTLLTEPLEWSSETGTMKARGKHSAAP